MPSALEPPARKVFLVGFMGSGKTSLGRLLAARLSWRFADVDAMIESVEGMSVRRLFAEKGEEFFRRAEREALAELAGASASTVIACGGGTYASPENRTLIERHGLSVWLDRPFEAIWASRDTLAEERPLLRSEREVRALFEARQGFYRLADVRCDLAGLDLSEAADTLERLVRARLEGP